MEFRFLFFIFYFLLTLALAALFVGSTLMTDSRYEPSELFADGGQRMRGVLLLLSMCLTRKTGTIWSIHVLLS